jgi:SAM-dependent methyltransferase
MIDASFDPASNTGLGFPDINLFIEAHNCEFDNKLTDFYNYSRVVSLANFARLTQHLGLREQDHVGVISGSLLDPELRFLNPKETTVLSFEVNPTYDLDLPWAEQISKEFSLTICNQTLEHVFNPHFAFKNLLHHTRVGGYLYVSIPTINCIHGEPYFYSSGFHPRFLERLGRENGVETVSLGWWGSYKYQLNAVAGRWLPERLLRAQEKPTLRTRFAYLRRLKKIPQSPILFAEKEGRLNEQEFITDCWALYRK